MIGTVFRTYRDDRPLPALSDASKRRGYVLFPIHWMDLVFPCTKPAADPGHVPLQVSAARGEFEPAVFALHALQALSIHDNLAVCRVIEPAHDMHKRRFATTRFADDSYHRLIGYSHRHIIKRREYIVLLAIDF